MRKLEVGESIAYVTFQRRVSSLTEALLTVNDVVKEMGLKGKPTITIQEYQPPTAEHAFMLMLGSDTVHEDPVHVPEVEEAEPHYIVAITGEVSVPSIHPQSEHFKGVPHE